jgi:hypothetical protein
MPRWRGIGKPALQSVAQLDPATIERSEAAMDIQPIHSEAEYDAALAEIDRYFAHEPEPGSAEGDCFEILLALIGAYEQKHWVIMAPDS